MSETEGPKSKPSVGWTDRQRLAYFISLVDYSKVKLDYANAPRPEGKSVGACQIMVHRLKATLRHDLEALRPGTVVMPDASPKKKTASSTPRKRKAEDDGAADAASPTTERGRKKKTAVEEEEPKAEEDGPNVKEEPGYGFF
ncbi:hypothetical protein ACEQ8H_001106 [Pleosporales sp. CAS-2024a]